MKKLLSVILVLTTFVVFCLPANGFAEDENVPKFRGMSDPALLQFVEDQVYSELASSLDSEDYIIENVQAVYISQEYLDELAFNSQANIFFGYSLEEIIAGFGDTAYVYSLGNNYQTTVKPFEKYEDTNYILLISHL